MRHRSQPACACTGTLHEVRVIHCITYAYTSHHHRSDRRHRHVTSASPRQRHADLPVSCTIRRLLMRLSSSCCRPCTVHRLDVVASVARKLGASLLTLCATRKHRNPHHRREPQATLLHHRRCIVDNSIYAVCGVDTILCYEQYIVTMCGPLTG